MPKTGGIGLGHSKHLHRHAFYRIGLDTIRQKIAGKPDHADRNPFDAGAQSRLPIAIQNFLGIWSVRPWNASAEARRTTPRGTRLAASARP